MILQGDIDLRIHVLQTCTIVPNQAGIPARFDACQSVYTKLFFLRLCKGAWDEANVALHCVAEIELFPIVVFPVCIYMYFASQAKIL